MHVGVPGVEGERSGGSSGLGGKVTVGGIDRVIPGGTPDEIGSLNFALAPFPFHLSLSFFFFLYAGFFSEHGEGSTFYDDVSCR